MSAPAPISLTASDGTGLRLLSLKASAVVEGPLAFTELHLVFHNAKDRQIEGRFAITLPGGAAISRFALLLPGGWQEAEVVERQAARQAYEDFLHRRQDPALLENEAGNEFSARVFPIPAGGQKEIKISYSQELAAADVPYRLPLRGLPTLDRLEIAAIADGQVAQVSRRQHVPEGDFAVRLARAGGGAAPGLRSDNLVVARVRAAADARAGATLAEPLQGVLLLVDTSASRAAGFARQVAGIGELIEEMARTQGADLTLQVACFDQEVEPVFSGAAGQFSRAHLDRILARGPLGASDLSGALGWAARQKGHRRLLLVTDGVVTAGRTGAELRQAARGLGTEVERLDVLLVGGIRDEAALRPLLSGNLRRDGALIDGGQPAAEILERLRRPTLSGVQVTVEGARWVWPAKLDSLQQGEDVLVYADMGAQAPDAVTVSLSGPLSARQRVPLRPVSRPLLERSFIRARIAALGQQGEELAAGAPARAREVRREIIQLSTKFRVLSDHTALLVLETEEDYVRFGIDRRALADILVVGQRGMEVLQRARPMTIQGRGRGGDPVSRTSPGATGAGAPAPGAPVAPPAAAAGQRELARRAGVLGVLRGSLEGTASVFSQESALGRDSSAVLGGLVGTSVGDAYGGAGMGLVGGSAGGGGTGEGSIGSGHLGTIGRGAGAPAVGGSYGSRVGGLRARRAAAPLVVPGTAEVRGALDRELIRRIIRRHINEPRFCYERELARNSALQGRVTVQFAIGPTGAVLSSSVQSSTMGNRSVEQCVADAVRRWEFPRPQGGIVSVTYPFVFRPADEDDAQAAENAVDPDATGLADDGDGWKRSATPAYTGKMLEVMDVLKRGKVEAALKLATRWRSEQPGDVMALVALGEALEAQRNTARAARAYGSIIDLFPSRADMRRFAGARLERLADAGLGLAVDTFTRAAEQRPDHPHGHRLRAYALLRQGRPEDAFAALEASLGRDYPEDRFRGVAQILREDLGLVGAAWARVAPQRRKEIEGRADKLSATLAVRPSLRFVLTWETDANDVDFHVHDGRGGHAYFSSTRLPSGGDLYADVTTGYGPECFTIEGQPRAFPYRLEAHYYARGPMGYGMGKVEILQHDGRGNLKFRQHPFVVMNDQAFVDLGTLRAPL